VLSKLPGGNTPLLGNAKVRESDASWHLKSNGRAACSQHMHHS
jgi:hypothetical protein